MIDSLTPEQEAQLPVYRNKWVNLALFGPAEIDEVALKEGIEFIYSLSNLEAPKDIRITDSPRAMAKLAAELSGQTITPAYISDTSLLNVGWVAFSDFFNKEVGIVTGDVREKLEKYIKYLESGVFSAIYFDELVVVSKRPTVVRRNEALQFHHDTLPAIEFLDGWKCYYLDGVVFEEDLYKKISTKTITLQEINAIPNADERAIAYKYGLPPREMLKDMQAVLVDIGQRGTELYEISNFMDTRTTQYAMLMQCPTGREFLEFVPPNVGEQRDADLAQANAYGISKEEYLAVIHHG